jgi:hypothetical protein
MGAKTGLLTFADSDVPNALRRAAGSDPGDSAGLVQRVHPGHVVERIEDGFLGDGTYPPDDVIYAATMGGVDILCDQRFMIEYPSRLPVHLVDFAAGRQIILHAMHSVVDWLAFAVWRDGRLIRSLSLSPDSGIVESIGEPG